MFFILCTLSVIMYLMPSSPGMRKLFIGAAFFCAFTGAQCQTATVTFYSPGTMAKAVGRAEITAGTIVHEPFFGWVFDGDQRISNLQRGHFVTVQIPSGHHVFSASYSSKHPANNALLPVELEAGKQYFIELHGKHYGALFVEAKFVGSLQEKSCEDAYDQASGFQPVPGKWVAKESRPNLVNALYFPNCKADQDRPEAVTQR